MSEHRLPRDSKPLDAEVFQVFEAATGKTTPIRELTDEALERNILQANQASKQMMVEAMKMFGQSQTAGKCASCMEYERDRRRRSIAIVRLQ
jgi:hypothetical protein